MAVDGTFPLENLSFKMFIELVKLNRKVAIEGQRFLIVWRFCKIGYKLIHGLDLSKT